MLCSNDSLLKFLASFEGRKEILWMFQGFLEVRKTVSELTCEHLRVLNIFQPDNAHIYVCCTVILQLIASAASSNDNACVEKRVT